MLDGGDSILLLTITDIRGKGEENIFLPPKPVYPLYIIIHRI